MPLWLRGGLNRRISCIIDDGDACSFAEEDKKVMNLESSKNKLGYHRSVGHDVVDLVHETLEDRDWKC